MLVIDIILIVLVVLFLACVLFGFYNHAKAFDIRVGTRLSTYVGELREARELGDGGTAGAILFFLIIVVVGVIRVAIYR